MTLTKKHHFTCASFSVVFLALSAIILKERDSLLAFAVLADQALTYALMPRRSVISLSLSALPALCLVLFFATQIQGWLIASIVLTAALWSLRLVKQLPDYRPTTDMWVGTLIMLESVAAMVCLIQ